MRIAENERYIASLNRMLKTVDCAYLEGKTILVSGASGMLGSCLVDALSVWNRGRTSPCRIAAVGRNKDSARQRFSSIWAEKSFSFYEQDVCGQLSCFPEQVDYIFHAASNADPVSMAGDPVGTLAANVQGTKNLMDYGMVHGMKRFLFVSSGEVYGQPNAGMDEFTEDYCGPLDLSSPRTCYPEGKRAAEVLCWSYVSQYGVDAVVVRPCHLFGPTMTGRDSRAVSEFFRRAVAGQDIVMKSAGLLERSHCYVVDAVKGLLAVLKNGVCGQTYNIADKRYQMTIRDFAEAAAKAGRCKVVYENPSELERAGYSVARRMVLSAEKLERLGWRAETNDAVGETVDILQG